MVARLPDRISPPDNAPLRVHRKDETTARLIHLDRVREGSVIFTQVADVPWDSLPDGTRDGTVLRKGADGLAIETHHFRAFAKADSLRRLGARLV